MELKVLGLNEDSTDKIFASAECQQVLGIYKDYYPKIGFNLPWVAYLVIKDGQVAGTCSFTGKPVNNTVELAYWTFKDFEGQGIASFACRQLVSIAKNENPDVIITAKTAPEKNASTRIMEKNGFEYSGIVNDDDMGAAWQWTHKHTK